MSTLFAIYQWGGVTILAVGVLYGLSGIGSIPFVERSKYSDSVLTRIGAGAGIAAIWPFFLLYYLLTKSGK
jgi:hypothetical protein